MPEHNREYEALEPDEMVGNSCAEKDAPHAWNVSSIATQDVGHIEDKNTMDYSPMLVPPNLSKGCACGIFAEKKTYPQETIMRNRFVSQHSLRRSILVKPLDDRSAN